MVKKKNRKKMSPSAEPWKVNLCEIIIIIIIIIIIT